MPRLARFAVIAVAAAVMAALTWGTWPDAIYDYGTHLYVPWRITQGQRLYADVAYFYGPLSEYLNAGLFRLFGVGLWTLVWANLAVLAAVLAMVDRLAGTAAALVVVGAFAFGQYVGIGNYNWACPYCHEVTHGVALGIGAVAAMAAHARTGRRRWLAAAGACVGLCLLTKAETAAAAVVAAGVAVVLGGAPDGRPGLLRRAEWVAGATFGVLVVAFALLATQVGPSLAAHALVVPWAWVFDRRVAGLAFYRQGMGTDDVGGNLRAMAAALAMTAVPVAAAWLTAWRRTRVVGLVVAVAAIATLVVEWGWAQDVARPWPVLVAGVVAVSVERAVRGPAVERATWVGRAGLAVLAVVLLGKMALAARVAQYGFTLAMPAAVVLTDAAVRWGPARLAARGGGRRWPAVVASAFVTVLVGIHVCVTLGFVAGKRTAVGTGRDAFWADARGAEVNAAVAAVRSTDTVLVAPQGLMVNYLARRADPLTVVNLMPPEVATAGEDRVLAELAARPPGRVVVVGKDTADGGFLLTEGHYVYGRRIVAWVRDHYGADQGARVGRGELKLAVLRWRLKPPPR